MIHKQAAMALSTARSFLSEAGYGEQELDANSALMELDKGVLARLVDVSNKLASLENAPHV